MRDELVLATGTSFLFGFEEGDYLVTARHNLTGRHADTNELLGAGAIPNQLEILTVVSSAARTGVTSQLVTGRAHRIRFDTLSNEGSELAAYGHPDGPTVDVACIGPFAREEELMTRAVNHEGYDLTPLQLAAGDDAFVLGYPNFVDGGAPFMPIWKRASLASYPHSADGSVLPSKVLLDTATRNGMSGAPVFVRQSGFIIPTPPYQREALLGDEIIGTAIDFLGCYTARFAERDALDSQLGIVWTRQAIEETIRGRTVMDLPD